MNQYFHFGGCWTTQKQLYLSVWFYLPIKSLLFCRMCETPAKHFRDTVEHKSEVELADQISRNLNYHHHSSCIREWFEPTLFKVNRCFMKYQLHIPYSCEHASVSVSLYKTRSIDRMLSMVNQQRGIFKVPFYLGLVKLMPNS